MNKKKVLLEFSNLRESIQSYYEGLRWRNEFADVTIAFKDGLQNKAKEDNRSYLYVGQELESRGLTQNGIGELPIDKYLEKSGFRILAKKNEDQIQPKIQEGVDYKDEKPFECSLTQRELYFNDETNKKKIILLEFTTINHQLKGLIAQFVEMIKSQFSYLKKH